MAPSSREAGGPRSEGSLSQDSGCATFSALPAGVIGNVCRTTRMGTRPPAGANPPPRVTLQNLIVSLNMLGSQSEAAVLIQIRLA